MLSSTTLSRVLHSPITWYYHKRVAEGGKNCWKTKQAMCWISWQNLNESVCEKTRKLRGRAAEVWNQICGLTEEEMDWARADTTCIVAFLNADFEKGFLTVSVRSHANMLNNDKIFPKLHPNLCERCSFKEWHALNLDMMLSDWQLIQDSVNKLLIETNSRTMFLI